MIKRIGLLLFILAGLVLSAVGCGGSQDTYDVRGRYVYDTTNKLSTESMLALSSRLWQVDSKTNYELVVVLPDKVMNEDEILAWFNKMGVGKKDRNDGTAIFIFPDNTWFIAIGTGNGAVSVPFSKTEGDKILTKDNLKNDLALSLIRYVERLRTQIETTVQVEVTPPFWNTLKPLLPMLLLWVLTLSLLIFLIQQLNGFQKTDLIAPIIILVIFGAFVGISSISEHINPSTYNIFGVITTTDKSTYDWIETQVYTTTDGEGHTTTHVRYIPHTDYINKTTIYDYDLKDYKHTFRTTDNRGAWNMDKGIQLELTIGIKSGELYGTNGFSDISGGTTIGDGAKSN